MSDKYLESITLAGEKLIVRDPNVDHDLTVEALLNIIYPVGSIIMRYDNSNPNTYLNVGKWVLITAGKYIRSTGGAGGATGGNNEVTLSVDNLPKHTHSLSNSGDHKHSVTLTSGGTHKHEITVNSGGTHTHSASSESAGTHNHSLKGHDGLGASGNSGIKLGALGSDLSTQICDTAGEHTHEIRVNNSGAHTHGADIENAGGHTHATTLSESGEHTHCRRNRNWRRYNSRTRVYFFKNLAKDRIKEMK